MEIYDILKEIENEPGSNAKMDILKKHKDNELLKKVIYAALSPRVKYYIRQIPEYISETDQPASLEETVESLKYLSSREYTGDTASKWLQVLLSGTSSNDSYVIERIIEKDLKIGMGTTNINKVIPKLIEKTPYMGAKPFSENLVRNILQPQTEGAKIAYSQIKMDGRYCNAIIEDGHVRLESRSGENTYLPGSRIERELSQFDDCVLNGELTMSGFDRNNSNGIVNSTISIATKIKNGEDVTKDKEHLEQRHGLTYEQSLERIEYTVWDRIELEDYENTKSSVPYNDRLQRLMNEFIVNQDNDIQNIEVVEQKIVTTYQEAIDHFVLALDRGLEGTILKSVDGAWKDGKPDWQVKMKLEIDIDMRIIGFNYGNKGTKNENLISSLTVESEDGNVVTRPCGISESEMKFITKNQDSLMGSIITMKCCGLSHDKDGSYSTLHPVYKSRRDDKDIADTLESIIEIENMAKTLS